MTTLELIVAIFIGIVIGSILGENKKEEPHKYDYHNRIRNIRNI